MMFLNTVTTTYSIDWDFLKLAAPFASILLSLATFIIALKLYDKHGLKKIIFEKKLKAILELAEAIKSFPIQFYVKDPVTNIPTTYSVLISTDSQKYKEINDLFSDYPIAAKYGYFLKQLQKFREYQNNPYLSKEICDSLDFLNFDTEYINSIGGYVLINSISYSDDYLDARVKPENDLKYGNFIQGFSITLQEIKKWLDKYAPLDDPLRL